MSPVLGAKKQPEMLPPRLREEGMRGSLVPVVQALHHGSRSRSDIKQNLPAGAKRERHSVEKLTITTLLILAGVFGQSGMTNIT
jgi:hypothetical protein